MNPIQKYPRIMELFTYILNIACFYVSISNEFFNIKTVKIINLKHAK